MMTILMHSLIHCRMMRALRDIRIRGDIKGPDHIQAETQTWSGYLLLLCVQSSPVNYDVIMINGLCK
jgi:hypothetical protein